MRPPDSETDDDWVYSVEPVGDTCPWGHPWNVNERLTAAEEALRQISRWPAAGRAQDLALAYFAAQEKP